MVQYISRELLIVTNFYHRGDLMPPAGDVGPPVQESAYEPLKLVYRTLEPISLDFPDPCYFSSPGVIYALIALISFSNWMTVLP